MSKTLTKEIFFSFSFVLEDSFGVECGDDDVDDPTYNPDVDISLV